MAQALTRSCLIVDGSPVDRESFTGYLDRHGFVVRAAADGVSALKMCRENMPDLILLSSKTPKLTGIQFLRRLRQSQRGRAPVVLYCAADDDAGQLGLAIMRGASECLMTPCDIDLFEFKLHQSGLI